MKAGKSGYPPAYHNLGQVFVLFCGSTKIQKKKKKKKSFLTLFPFPSPLQCYEYGLGVEESQEEAFKWYQKGAKSGHMDSLLAMGLCYENGIGCEKSEEKAKEIYQEAMGLFLFLCVFQMCSLLSLLLLFYCCFSSFSHSFLIFRSWGKGTREEYASISKFEECVWLCGVWLRV